VVDGRGLTDICTHVGSSHIIRRHYAGTHVVRRRVMVRAKVMK